MSAWRPSTTVLCMGLLVLMGGGFIVAGITNTPWPLLPLLVSVSILLIWGAIAGRRGTP